MLEREECERERGKKESNGAEKKREGQRRQ